jgi:type VI secretion system protein
MRVLDGRRGAAGALGRRAGLLGLAAAGLLLLGGCASPQVSTEGIQFQVLPEVNRNAPVALDLVLVYDPNLLAVVGKFSAGQWFAQRAALRQRFPQQLLSWQWEAVPGQPLEPFSLPEEADEALGVFLFAGYATPGLHSARLDPYKQVLIRLEENAMRVLPIEYY